MPTALLICLENTFWTFGRDGNFDFVESFKKSFTLYGESGMREKVEAAIDVLKNEQGGWAVTKDVVEKFYKIIVGHFLCRFHFFYLHLSKSNI
jgi:hypothetical protein